MKIKITYAILFIILTVSVWGFLLPYLLSANSTPLVQIGIAVIAAWTGVSIYYINKITRPFFKEIAKSNDHEN